MTSDEFRAYIHGPSGKCLETPTVHDRINMESVTPDIDAPSSIDWRNNNGDYVTPVKNQGQCGSCWVCNKYATCGVFVFEYYLRYYTDEKT